MIQPFEFLETRWLASVLIVLALMGGIALLGVRIRAVRWSFPLIVLSGASALLGIGGLSVPPAYAFWIAIAAVACLFLMLLVMVLSSYWWAPLAWVAAAVALVGVGDLGAGPIGDDLAEAYRFVRNLRPLQPWWLLLLLLIPLIILLSFRSLSGLGPVRRWVAIGLRCALVLFLTLALAEAATTTLPEITTVLFVFDGSQSVPKELADRGEKFINDAVEQRGAGHERDRAGLIVFGKQPRLERPPSDAGMMKFKFKEMADSIDGNYTNISAALKLALASFPEGSGKRIVLISDGSENLGNAREQGEFAKVNGVQIDVVPLATGTRNQNEVLVHSIEAPGLIEQGSQLPIRVLVRSYNPNLVVGTLRVQFQKDGVLRHVVGSPRQVTLQLGLNAFTFQQQLEGDDGQAKQIDSQQSYTFEAEFQPLQVLDEKGNVLMKGLPGDRVENNRARTHVVARGQRRVLLVEKRPVEGRPREHEFLAQRLAEAGNGKFKVAALTSEMLPKDPDRLALMLSDYDCVILANVPAEEISEQQQEVIRSNTHDQGCGLIMIGGPEGFGAGGWQGTPVEKALPVDCDIKAMKVQGTGGLVLIFHASEAENQNSWQKEVGKLAIKKLSADDMVGVMEYGFSPDGEGTAWPVPFQTVGDKRSKLLGLVNKMAPGDMPDCNPFFRKAHAELTNPKYKLGKKHIIFISDGDHWTAHPAALNLLRNSKVTCTTVCVTTHGQAEIQKMSAVAAATGGKFYNVTNPKALPEIYTKEVRLISQSFLYERKFEPKLAVASGPADKLPEKLDPLYGFVRTTAKPSLLVERAILGPPQGDQDFPVLAFWQYGLGKSAAWTSDARSGNGRRTWDQDWADSPLYKRFWEQMVDWTLRAVETGALTMTTEYRDGKVRVIVEARDKHNQNRPLTDLKMRGAVTPPSGRPEDAKKYTLKFEQKASGRYEAEFKADEAGSYFVTAQPTRTRRVTKKVKEDGKEVEKEIELTEGIDSVRSGVTVPYSPEFADVESNVPLLEEVRRLTGGKSYLDDAQALRDVAATGDVFREGPPQARSMQPFWHWLLLFAGVVLVGDVAVRRIAIEPSEAIAAAARLWGRLRGQAVQEAPTTAFLERLKSRKEQVGETLERARAATRFEGGDAPAPPPGAEAAATPLSQPRPAAPPPKIAPEKEAEPADFASRLMKAKKKVWEERDKDKGKNP